MDPLSGSGAVLSMAPLIFIGYLFSVALAVVTLDTDITLKQIAVAVVVGNLISIPVGFSSPWISQAMAELIRDPVLAILITSYGMNFIIQLLNLRYIGKISWKAGIKISLLSTLILITIFLPGVVKIAFWWFS